eukprot:13552503-Alexandrium_andersonii.AAC.1
MALVAPSRRQLSFPSGAWRRLVRFAAQWRATPRFKYVGSSAVAVQYTPSTFVWRWAVRLWGARFCVGS